MSQNSQDEQKSTVSIVLEQQTESNFFTINSHKAAEILGVNRTRLSQLTSQGIFPYERRKVDARSRLYYRLNDLLNYQRKSSFGNLHATGNYDPNPNMPLLMPPHSIETASQSAHVSSSQHTKTASNSKKILLNHKTSKNVRRDRSLTHALVLKTKQENFKKLKDTKTSIEQLEEKYQKITQILSNLEQAIGTLNAHYSKRQKPVLRSPVVKRTFKFVKRRNLK